MPVHPSLASHAASSHVAGAAAVDAPPPRLSREKAQEHFASCLIAHYLSQPHEGLDEARHLEEAIGKAREAAEAMFVRVSDGHVDFTGLNPLYVPAAATLPRAALEVLASYLGGIANFALPHGAGAVPGYDPASLAENLNAAAPHLAYLELPAPQLANWQWPAMTVLDLRGLRVTPPPVIRVLRDSTSVLGVLLDKTAGAPTCTSTPPASGDPLAMAPSLCVWMEGDKAVWTDKLGNAYYHHSNSKSRDAELDRARQVAAVDTKLNQKSNVENMGLAVCADFVMHMLQEMLTEAIFRELTITGTPREEQHPALKGLGTIEGIASTVKPISRARHIQFISPGQWTPCHAPSLGKTLRRLLQASKPGDERFFVLWAPGRGGVEETHAMFVRVRVKEKPAHPAHSAHVRDAKDSRRFVPRFYEPQITGDWARGFCDSLDDLAELSIDMFIRREWLDYYMSPESPICAIREWPGHEPRVAEAEADVPPQMRATPEYLWAASLGGPKMLQTALERVLALPREEYPMAYLNPVFGGPSRSVLGWLVSSGDKAAADAYVETIVNSRRLLPGERCELAASLLTAVLPCGHHELAADVLSPLIRIAGVATFVSAALRCGRPDGQVKAIFERTITLTYAAEQRSMGDDNPSLAVAAAIEATFPPGDPRVDQWAREFGVMGKGPTLEQVMDVLDPKLPAARMPTLEDPAPADIAGAFAEESAADRCEWELACLRRDVLAWQLHPETEGGLRNKLDALARKIEHYKATGEIREFDDDPSSRWFRASWERRANEMDQLMRDESAAHARQVSESLSPSAGD